MDLSGQFTKSQTVSKMELKLNIILTIDAPSSQSAYRIRDKIDAAIEECDGVTSVDESWITATMPDFGDE